MDFVKADCVHEGSPAVQRFQEFLQAQLAVLQGDLVNHLEAEIQGWRREGVGSEHDRRNVGPMEEPLAVQSRSRPWQVPLPTEHTIVEWDLDSAHGLSKDTEPKEQCSTEFEEMENESLPDVDLCPENSKRRLAQRSIIGSMEGEEALEEGDGELDLRVRRSEIIKSKSMMDQLLLEQIRFHSARLSSHSAILITKSLQYQFLIGLMIISNSAFIGWQVDHQARYGQELEFDAFLSYAFCIVFTTDILLRLCEEGKRFFFGDDRYWNAFDSFLVLNMVLEMINRISTANASTQSSSLSSLTVLRLGRIIRVFRIFRILRSLSAFRDFRVLCIALMSASAWRSLIWMFLMIAAFIYLGSLAITNGVGDTGACSAANGDDIELCRYFGTLDRSALSFYKALYGGIPWGNLIGILDELGSVYVGLFCFLMSIFLLLLGNICTGVVIKLVYDAVENTKEHLVLEKSEENRRLIRAMNEVFFEADIDGSGTVSAMEFDLLVRQPKLESAFHILDMSTSDAKTLFSVLDADDSGEISTEEFVMGCLKFKGAAKGLDLFLMASQMRMLSRDTQDIKKLVEVGFASRTRQLDEHQTHLGQNTSIQLPNPRNRRSQREGTGTLQLINILPYPQHANGNGQIAKVQMRAMSLRELYDVTSVIKIRCAQEFWIDHWTDEQLHPEDVNLHHLVHNYICPATIQDGIILEGLQQNRRFEAGYRVLQLGPQGHQQAPEAEGYVKEVVNGDELYIHVKRGLFRSPELGAAGTVVIHDGTHCGVPRKVVAPGALSYKELICGRPTKPRWFCSHWWCMRVMEFVVCCEEHAKRRGLDEDSATYWICAYALRQYELRVDVNERLEDTAFWKTLNIAEGVLCVIDTNAVVFKRIWVDFELFVTISDNKKLDMVTVQQNRPVLLSDGILPNESNLMKTARELQFPISVLIKGMYTLLQDGSATIPADRDRVLKLLFAHFSCDINEINRHLHAYFAKAALPQAISRGSITDFDRANPRTLSLPVVIKKDSLCRRILMSFNHMSKVTDAVVKQIASGIPSKLEELEVDLQGCNNITDMSVASIAEKLPASLHALRLNYIGCKHVGNGGLERLAAYLPSNLRELQLDFASCHSIDMAGVSILADQLPQNLTNFRATFQGTRFDCNVMSVDELDVALGRNFRSFLSLRGRTGFSKLSWARRKST